MPAHLAGWVKEIVKSPIAEHPYTGSQRTEAIRQVTQLGELTRRQRGWPMLGAVAVKPKVRCYCSHTALEAA
jgi:hypothetical protein